MSVFRLKDRRRKLLLCSSLVECDIPDKEIENKFQSSCVNFNFFSLMINKNWKRVEVWKTSLIYLSFQNQEVSYFNLKWNPQTKRLFQDGKVFKNDQHVMELKLIFDPSQLIDPIFSTDIKFFSNVSKILKNVFGPRKRTDHGKEFFICS